MINRRGILQLFGATGAGLMIPATGAMATGTAYYVSGAGSDSNNGRTPETAFRTLQKAADLANPGDTVYAMNGDYANTRQDSGVLTIARPGIGGAPVSYRNYPGHKPRIVVGANNWKGIEIRASYITVEGFEIAGNAANIGYQYAYSQKDNKYNCATNANGIFVDGRKYGTFHHIAIRNNDVHHMPGGGIAIVAADYVSVVGNEVHSCAWWNVYGCSGLSIYSSRDIDSNTSAYKTLVRRNICYDNENYIPTYSSGKIADGNGIIVDDNKNTQQDGVAAYRGRTLVTNNLCYNNGGTGMHAYLSSRIDIVNNTAFGNNRSPALDNGEISTGDSTSVRLYNNVLSARDGKRCQHYWRNVDVEYNYNIYHNGSVVVRGPNDITADPRFVNPSVNPAEADFRLLASSPGIDSGTLKLAPENDLVRNPRRKNSIDRGSYERLA